MRMLEFPYPVSANRYWRTFRGMTVRSKEAQEYKESAAVICEIHRVKILTCPVTVSMTLHPPIPKDWKKREQKEPRYWPLSVRRLDLDNCQKVILDALQGLAYENDKQITAISITLGIPMERGCIMVGVEPDPYWSTPEQRGG